jgi:hypothetical protein
MTESEMAAVIDRAVRYAVRGEANRRPYLLDDETVARAHASHMAGLNLQCLGRHYGVRAGYLGRRFRELGLPVRNYTSKRARAAALAAEEEGER